MMPRTRSEQLFDEALRLIPGGVNSPVRAFRAVGGQPGVLAATEHEFQELRQVVEVLAGVLQVDDLCGLGQTGGGEVPDLIPVLRMWAAPRRP